MSLALLVSTLLTFVSPEQGVGALTPGPSSAQSTPAVAFDGANYLVVWHDHRTGDDGNLFARLVSRAGVPQGNDFHLVDEGGGQEAGSVLFDGTNFVVAMGFGGFPALVRLNRAGAVLDPSAIVLSGSVSSKVQLAFDGTNYLMVWADSRAPFKQIYAARVSRAGQVIDQGGRLISSNLSTDACDPDVTFDGTDFVVAWSEDESLVSTRVAADATPIGPGAVAFFTSATELRSGPRLAAIAGGAVATFLEYSADLENEPRIIAVQLAATPSIVSSRHAWDNPVLSFDGARFLAIWSDDAACRLFAARFSPALAGTDGDGLQLMAGTDGHQSEAALAFDGTGGLLTWNSSDFSNRIATSTFDATLSITGTGTPLTASASEQREPSVGVAGSRALLGWVEQAATSRNVWLASVLQGTPAPVSPVEVTTGAGDRSEQSLATDGANRALLTWRNENGELLGRLYDGAGAPVSAAQVLCDGAGTSSFNPEVAWDGVQFVVGFMHEAGPVKTAHLVRVAADGAPTVRCGLELATINTPTDSFLSLRVAAGGGTALVLLNVKDEVTYTHRVEFLRERGGALVDATPQLLAGGAGASADGARATWDGAAFIAVWHQRRRWSNDIVATRVPPSGAVTDSFHPLVTSEQDELRPDLAFDGTRALVTWEDRRRGRPDVYARFLDAQLNPTTLEGFPVSATSQEENAPRVAAVSPGRFVVAYRRVDATPTVQARRVGLRWVSDLAQAATCGVGGECQSGFCVDGVCCDTRCGDGANDCEACSAARGAATDGVCSVLAATTECRASGSECDVAERCDGTARVCPVDQQRPDGLSCASGTGVCGAGSCLTGMAPRFTSAVQVQLICGQTYSYSKAGRPQVAGDGPFTFSARSADGAALPDGFSIDPQTGDIAWQTTKQQAGAVTIELRVESAAGADTQLVELVVECQQRNVTVSCSQAGLLGLPLLGVLLLRRRRRS